MSKRSLWLFEVWISAALSGIVLDPRVPIAAPELYESVLKTITSSNHCRSERGNELLVTTSLALVARKSIVLANKMVSFNILTLKEPRLSFVSESNPIGLRFPDKYKTGTATAGHRRTYTVAFAS